MRKEFVMRGKTASGLTEVLQFGKYKAGYAYRMTEFQIYPSTNIGGVNAELAATVTAAKTFEDPANPNFNNEGLIGTALFTSIAPGDKSDSSSMSVVNDTFLITQNLILAVIDTIAGSPMNVNWQCRFESVKMTGPEEAAVNFKQFSISDG
jgi:hypothetical protein